MKENEYLDNGGTLVISATAAGDFLVPNRLEQNICF